MSRPLATVMGMRPSVLGAVLLTAVVATTAFYFISPASEADVPQYQRRFAAEAACKAAEIELLSLPPQSPTKFVDDCVLPKVTLVLNKPGYLIVTRVVEVRAGKGSGRHQAYSALMDGRRTDAWRALEVQSAPNELTVVLSPYALLAGEAAAR